MKEKTTSFIDQTFYPAWLMVSQLRNGQEITDGETLYRRTSEWIDRWRNELSDAGISQLSTEHMLYALCALFDESVLNRNKQDNGYTHWLSNPLQAKYFNTLNAGEELWERIRQVLHEPSPDTHVLTCFYRVLQMGFSGRYRSHNDERREDVIQTLSRQVPPFILTQETPIVSRVNSFRSARRRYNLSWAAGIALLIGMWLLFSSSLNHLVSSITEIR